MKTFMFPGQGSQARGMGRSLFDLHPDLLAIADRVLGWSVREVCLDDPRRELDHTQFTQPAIYVVNAMAWLERQAREARPDFVAGHSLGEFSALLAAEAFDFETGLRLVQRRGELMSRAPDGAMAAILSASQREIEEVLAASELDEIDIANLNTPSQIVISGSRRQIGEAQEAFQQGRMQYIPLNTSGAFHSRFMAPARAEFEEFLRGFQFRELRIPVIANVTARPYDADVAGLLGRQITSTVRWCESIEYLQGQAAAQGETIVFEEVGHGDVLARMAKKIQAEASGAPLPVGKIASPPRPHPGQAPTAPVPAAPAPTPEEKVRRWNLQHPVGTRVRSLVVGEELATRTQATLLFRHRPAIYLQGYNGYFDLDELIPV